MHYFCYHQLSDWSYFLFGLFVVVSLIFLLSYWIIKLFCVCDKKAPKPAIRGLQTATASHDTSTTSHDRSAAKPTARDLQLAQTTSDVTSTTPRKESYLPSTTSTTAQSQESNVNSDENAIDNAIMTEMPKYWSLCILHYQYLHPFFIGPEHLMYSLRLCGLSIFGLVGVLYYQ